METSPLLAEAYDEAWERYEVRCLWNVQRFAHPTPEDARDVAQRLRQHGDMDARRIASRIEVAADEIDRLRGDALPSELLSRLDRLAARIGCSRVELINRVLPPALRDEERMQDVADFLREGE